MIGKLPATHIAVQYYLKKPFKLKAKYVIVYRHFSSLQENSTCSERSSRKNEGLISDTKLLRTHSKAKQNIATTRSFHNIPTAIGMNKKTSSSAAAGASSLRRRLQYPEDIFTKYASITTGAANPQSESEGARTGKNSSSRSANTNSIGNGNSTGSREVKAKGHPINDRRNKKGRRPKEGEMEGMKKNGMGEGSRSNKEGKGKGKGKDTYTHKGRWRTVNKNGGHAKIKIMSDFASFVRDSQAARYKVHKPQCSCGKVTALHKNNRQITKSMDQDAFVILPEIKSIQSVFVGGSAPAESYSRDPIKCEKSLLDIIYPPKKTSSSAHVDDDHNDNDIDIHHNRKQPNIKTSFASCILDHEPNGFLCIASPSRAVVDDAKNRTLEARKINMKRGKIFHADHANYICTLHQKALEKLVRPQSHSQNAQGDVTDSDPSFKALLQSMQDQGVEAYAHTNTQDTSVEGYDDNEKTNTDRKPIVTIKIGHHLKTMLRIMKGQNNFIYTIIAKSPTKNGGCTLEIDLPGGKRHIAETSFRCCVRETEEETSLLIDETWLTTGNREPIKSKSKFENGNAFFLARPPGEEGLGGGGEVEAVLADVFWKNTGLGGK